MVGREFCKAGWPLTRTRRPKRCARVQAVEHQIYPEAANWFGQGRLEFRAGAAWLDGKPLETPVIADFF